MKKWIFLGLVVAAGVAIATTEVKVTPRWRREIEEMLARMPK